MIVSLNNLSKSQFALKRVEKGWGHEVIHQTEPYTIKILNYKDDCYSSGHLHTKKDETFIILSGKFELTTINAIGKKIQTILHPNDVIYLEHGRYHQIYCFEEGSILEMSTTVQDDDTVIIDQGMSQINLA